MNYIPRIIYLILVIVFYNLLFVNKVLGKDSCIISIIPQPSNVKISEGLFLLDHFVSISSPEKNEQLETTIQWFRAKIANSTGVQLLKKNGKKTISIKFNNSLSEEAYKLKVTLLKIEIEAKSPAGVFYALQTLLQLLPADIECSVLKQHVAWTIPCVEISDNPRFKWRGLMLDVSRHFFSKEEVMRYIDEMARYKFNTLHWHLTDDEGWRIEIKSLPELTLTGAWRVNRTGKWGTFDQQFSGEKSTYGGYYTQDDVREVVAYAKARFVTIVPEIDVPGHSLALIASYPNISCTQISYAVNGGRKFYTKDDNALCIGNDSVFIILNKIFTELAELFPCQYIHIGGDEAYKKFWHNCEKCQRLIKQEHLMNEEELQSYFIKRIEQLLKSKQKKVIGWDDILQGGLAPDATVMSYKGMEGGTSAAKMMHSVIMTPDNNCYLDYYQGDPLGEPIAAPAMCRISDCYNYEPMPKLVDEKLILGGEGNLWSEHIPTFRHLEYMTWPRALALAEVYWSEEKNKNWKGFITKVEHHFLRLDDANIKYSKSMYNVMFNKIKLNDYDFSVSLSTEIDGLDIYYSFDETDPDKCSPKFTNNPIIFPEGATHLKVITYRDGKPIGAQINMPKEILSHR